MDNLWIKCVKSGIRLYSLIYGFYYSLFTNDGVKHFQITLDLFLSLRNSGKISDRKIKFIWFCVLSLARIVVLLPLIFGFTFLLIILK